VDDNVVRCAGRTFEPEAAVIQVEQTLAEPISGKMLWQRSAAYTGTAATDTVVSLKGMMQGCQVVFLSVTTGNRQDWLLEPLSAPDLADESVAFKEATFWHGKRYEAVVVVIRAANLLTSLVYYVSGVSDGAYVIDLATLVAHKLESAAEHSRAQ